MGECEEQKERFIRKNNPIVYGLMLSALLISAYFLLGLQQKCIGTVCETNFERFFEADPNEIGDTLAGLFAALAFVWIIVTVFLQSLELREQRKELREQREATQQMAGTMAAQATIFLDEQKQRSEDRAGKELDSLCELVLSNYEFYRNNVYFITTRGEHFSSAHNYDLRPEERERIKVILFQEFNLGPRIDDSMRNLQMCVSENEALVNRVKGSSEVFHRCGADLTEDLIETLDKILSLEPSLSAGDRNRLQSMRIEICREELCGIHSFLVKGNAIS